MQLLGIFSSPLSPTSIRVPEMLSGPNASQDCKLSAVRRALDKLIIRLIKQSQRLETRRKFDQRLQNLAALVLAVARNGFGERPSLTSTRWRNGLLVLPSRREMNCALCRPSLYRIPPLNSAFSTPPRKTGDGPFR